MKRVFFYLIFFLEFSTIIAQKKPIDVTIFDNWPHIEDEKVNSRGEYLMYTKRSRKGFPVLKLEKIDKSWKREFVGAYTGDFVGDQQYAIIKFHKDSLALVELGTNDVHYISSVSSYKMPKARNDKWIAYQVNNLEKELILLNVTSGRRERFEKVNEYLFSDNGEVLLVQAEIPKQDGSPPVYILYWVDLSTMKSKIIMNGTARGFNFSFDSSAMRLAFLCSYGEANEENTVTLKYFKVGMDSVITRIGNGTLSMKQDYAVSRDFRPNFSKSGMKLFLGVEKIGANKVPFGNKNIASVDVWNYKDRWLQSHQLNSLNWEANRIYLSVINEKDGKLIHLEKDNDALIVKPRKFNGGDGEYVLIREKVNENEKYWNVNARPNLYLVSTTNGDRTLVGKNVCSGMFTTSVSPNGKYIVWFDFEQHCYIAYNVATGKLRNISDDIPYYSNASGQFDKEILDYGIAGWAEDDAAIFIYDRYDIWQVDPEGRLLPKNITNGYGKRNRTLLRLMDFQGGEEGTQILEAGQKFVLTAFNESNQFNGFFEMELMKGRSDPEKLYMGPYSFYFPRIPSSSIAFNSIPIKANNANVYIVRRMSATEYPNLFVTKDFKKFIQLTNLTPQANVNWMTAELVNWNLPDGTESSGILYKPENFSPKKKYPIIFYYYEKLSYELNKFKEPQLSNGAINIPYFVSNGYLVFCPDIHYKKGQAGRCAYESVISAARYLCQFSWIDSTCMGLQGHSFGGYETNYIITHSNLFAAGVSAAGASDLISLYGALRGNSESNQTQVQYGQYRLGETLWSNPELYINNSPIFNLDKVNTPLLIMHNMNDKSVPWQQSVELFTNLRRLNKKVWMLQYDGESHVLTKDVNKLDYTLRMKQFFDLFLKHEPAPEWIIDGVPANLKGIKTGLESRQMNLQSSEGRLSIK